MANSADLSDGARQANLVSSEDAEILYGSDQAETHMVKLVDGKLVEMANTHADVSEDMPRIRLGSDEERALVGDDKKKYENSDAALRAGNSFDPSVMPDNPHAEADITGNPDAGSSVNTGLPSEHSNSANTASHANDSTPNDRIQPNGEDVQTTATSPFAVTSEMVPSTPSTPDPNNPVPSGPETPTPPLSPDPMPEISPLPNQPRPFQPEIQEPGEPDRSHQIGFVYHQNSALTGWPISGGASVTATITPTPADQLPIHNDDLEPGEAMPGNQYDGLSAGPDDMALSTDEGMDDQPETGDSTHRYDVRGSKDSSYQPGERPQETAQMMSQPMEALDESEVKAGGSADHRVDRSETKSTDGLDRKYNDLDAERDKTAY